MTLLADAGPAGADLAAAERLLHRHFGYTAFRPAQARVIRSVLAGRDTLAVLPTGAGKSVCFQIPALLQEGLTVVISPLVALMQDQVSAAQCRGVAARGLNGLQPRAAQDQVRADLARGEVKLLYVAPERCRTLLRELAAARQPVSLLAVDEAHCLAEWGHDFRPAYLGLRRFREAVGSPPAVALTGSATPSVRSELAAALGLGTSGGYDLHLGSFDRRNLWFGVTRVANDRDRLERLCDLLARDDRIAIVYASTRNLTEAIARVLRERGYRALAYHAGLSRSRREDVLGDFLDDRLEVVTATCAFGLGIDKPNVRLVVHWTLPPTPEAYYQEAGRAGRDGEPARCVLLFRPGDEVLPKRQLEVTFPDRRLVERAWRDSAARARLPRNVAAAVERLRVELWDGRRSSGWARVERRRRAAAARLGAIVDYAAGAGCRRARLLAYFGERLRRCSGCDRCSEPRPPVRDAEVRSRLRRLTRAVVASGGSGGRAGDLLAASTLHRLAADPPRSLEQLAGVPGVGPVVADRMGGPILAALGSAAPVEPGAPAVGEGPGLLGALRAWRAQRARALAWSAGRVAPDVVLEAIARRRPASRSDLARIPGVGPRFLAVEAEGILGLVKSASAPESALDREGPPGRPPVS